MHSHQLHRRSSMNWMKVGCALFLLFLTGCASIFNGADASHTPPATSTPTRLATVYVSAYRPDGNVENPLALQLAKIQNIMAGMTLDQKLAQLLIVEYL